MPKQSKWTKTEKYEWENNFDWYIEDSGSNFWVLTSNFHDVMHFEKLETAMKVAELIDKG